MAGQFGVPLWSATLGCHTGVPERRRLPLVLYGFYTAAPTPQRKQTPRKHVAPVPQLSTFGPCASLPAGTRGAVGGRLGLASNRGVTARWSRTTPRVARYVYSLGIRCGANGGRIRDTVHACRRYSKPSRSRRRNIPAPPWERKTSECDVAVATGSVGSGCAVGRYRPQSADPAGSLPDREPHVGDRCRPTVGSDSRLATAKRGCFGQ